MNDWNIQIRSRECQKCTRPFVDKAPYHTVLFADGALFRRVDVCDTCWQQQVADEQGPPPISHWQGVYEAPPAAPPDAIQKESAETLLRKLIEQNDPTHLPACYILAVMLERKRILKVKEQFRRENARYFVYEQPKTGDVFTIRDPDLQLNQLEAVQKDVSELLERGLDGKQPPMPNVASSSEAPVEAVQGEPLGH